MAGFFAGGRRNGPAGAIFGAFAGATLARRYAPGLFSSRKLKFQEAVLRGDSETVSRLANSQYVDARIKGFPPIYYASIRGDTETVSVLARYGASMRYRYDGHSLAYIAAENGHLQTAEALVRYDGGTSADVSGGRALYATNIQEQKKEAAACCATALLFLDAELKSSASSNSEDNEHNYDNSGLSRDEYQEYLNNISDH